MEPISYSLDAGEKELLGEVFRAAEMERPGHLCKVIETDHHSATARRYYLVNAFLDLPARLVHCFVRTSTDCRWSGVLPASDFERFIGASLADLSPQERIWALDKFLEAVKVANLYNAPSKFEKDKAEVCLLQVEQPGIKSRYEFMLDWETHCSIKLLVTPLSLLALVVDLYKLEQGCTRHFILLKAQPVATSVCRKKECSPEASFYRCILEKVGFRAIRAEIEERYRQRSGLARFCSF